MKFKQEYLLVAMIFIFTLYSIGMVYNYGDSVSKIRKYNSGEECLCEINNNTVFDLKNGNSCGYITTEVKCKEYKKEVKIYVYTESKYVIEYFFKYLESSHNSQKCNISKDKGYIYISNEYNYTMTVLSLSIFCLAISIGSIIVMLIIKFKK